MFAATPIDLFFTHVNTCTVPDGTLIKAPRLFYGLNSGPLAVLRHS